MKTVQIKPGDTLSKIAKAHNTTVDALVKANNIQNPNLINAGKILRIPDGFETTQSTSTAWNNYSNGTNSTTPTHTSGQATASDGRSFPTSADGTPIFKQGDAQWGGRTLGTSKTLSSHGCAVTASAMALSKISGQVIDPGQLDAYLDSNKGYDGNNLYWGKAAGMAGMSATSGGMNFDTINKQLDAGRPVVIAVDHTGDGKTDHYVTLTGRNGNTYSANDPATGKEMSFNLQNGKLVGQSNNKTYQSSGQAITFSGGNPSPGTSAPASLTTETKPTAETKSTVETKPTTETKSTAESKSTTATTSVNATDIASLDAACAGIPGYANNPHVTPEFKAKTLEIAKKLGIDPKVMVSIMAFESGLNPARKNMAGSGATGLIQFMPKTAASLGTTTDALAGMSSVQQLDYVEKYFSQPHLKGKIKTVADAYMAVLWPAAVGKPMDHVLFRAGSTTYEQNKGLDLNKDGVITKEEASYKVRKFAGEV